MISFSDNERRADYQELESLFEWSSTRSRVPLEDRSPSRSLWKSRGSKKSHIFGKCAVSQLENRRNFSNFRIVTRPGIVIDVLGFIFISFFSQRFTRFEHAWRAISVRKKGRRGIIGRVHSSLCFRDTTFPFWPTQFRLENRRCDGTNGRAGLDVA